MTKKSSGESLEEKTIESAPAEVVITAEEFCKKLSVTDRRVELIGGFFYWVEKEKKITKATEKTFAELFGQFVKMPV